MPDVFDPGDSQISGPVLGRHGPKLGLPLCNMAMWTGRFEVMFCDMGIQPMGGARGGA